MADDEEALSWANLVQVEIDKIWLHVANDMEEEVLTRDKVRKEARCEYKGRGEPLSEFTTNRDGQEARLRVLRELNV